jgi:putative transposase
LRAIKDEHSKRVLGWPVADHMLTELVTDALAQAVAVRGGPVGGTIMHSDHRLKSDQYTARAMAQACADAGLRRSMGATGICWDDSGAESLWSTFKQQYYYRHVFATKAELVAAVDRWMHLYNTQRRHSVIGMLSPSPMNNHWTRPPKPHKPLSTFRENLTSPPAVARPIAAAPIAAPCARAWA